MPNWKKVIVSGSSAELKTLKLTNTSAQNSEATSLMINGDGTIGTRELGSNAFNSNTYNNYSLPLGTSSTRGGFKIGYTESGKNYPVELSSEKMYVNVPWTDTNTQATRDSLGLDTDDTPAFAGLTLSGVANPQISFNGSSDAGVDMAIKATPEALQFFEPEDSNKVHFEIKDDTGVSATYGYQVNGTTVITSGRALQNVSGNISMFTNDSGYSTTDTNTVTSIRRDNTGTYRTGNINLVGGTNVTISEGSAGVFTIASTDTNTNTTYSAGSGLTLTGTTFSHTDTSTQASSNNSGRTYIQDITLDTYGHVTGLATATETVVNTDTQLSTEEVRAAFSAGTNVQIEDGVISATDTNTNTVTSIRRDNTGTYRTGNINLVGGSNVTISEGSAGVFTIASTDTNTNTTYSAGTGLSLSGTTFSLSGDTFDNEGTYSKLRAQATTAGDVGLGNVTNESKATMFSSAALTGNPTAPTQTAGNDSTRIATTAFVGTAIDNLIGGAPGTLDTLDEIAAALNDDAALNTTLTNSIATKLPKSGGTMTGAIAMGNNNITGINNLIINDPGPNEGISWNGGNIKIYESPNDLTTNTAGNLQVVYGSTRRFTVDNTGINVNGNANISGTITNATWNGDVIADSYLSTNTAHLSGTQTFTGIKTFNAKITAASTLAAESGIKFTGLAGSTSAKALMIDSDGVVGTRGLSTQAFSNYTLPAGSSSTRGGFKIGYTENGKNYPVEVSSEKMYVNVPWTDTNTDTNTFRGVRTTNGDTQTSLESTETLTLKAGTNVSISETDGVVTFSSTDTNTNTTYSAGNGLSLSGTTFSHSDTSTQASSNNSGRTYIQDITLDTYGHVTGLSTATETVVNTDTNTQLSTEEVRAAFDAGSNITIEDGVISATDTNTTYSTATSSTLGLVKIGYSENGKNYPVELSSGKMFVNVPWSDTNTDTNTVTSIRRDNTGTYRTGNINLVGGTNVTISEGSAGVFTIASTDTNTTYVGEGIIGISGNKIFHKDTSSQASVNNSGNTVIQDVTLDTYGHVTALSSKTLSIPSSADIIGEFTAGTGIQITEDGEISSTVTNTNTTYSADGNYGLTLSGTTFRLEDDRRRNSSSTDIKTGNTHDYTWYDADVGIRWYVAGAEDMRLQNGGTLQVDGDVVAYSTTISDERLKDNVTTIENPLDKIKALRGVEYDWNAGSRKGKRDLGLIAQEVEKVIPNIVHEHEQPFLNDDEDDKTLYKTVDYEKMVAVLIEGMKEQQSQIDELKSEINQLKGKV